MSNLKQVKSKIKEQKNWKKYKKVFKHKQMRLVYSHIVLIFDQNAKAKNLAKAEIALSKTKKGPQMFDKTFNKLCTLIPENIDWESLAKFMWFQYQTSTYWKDIKKKRKNIFNNENYIEMNAEKRVYWQNWISSLDKNNKEFNNIITSLLRKVT